LQLSPIPSDKQIDTPAKRRAASRFIRATAFSPDHGPIIAEYARPVCGRSRLMQSAALYGLLKAVSLAILLLMLAAIGYGGFISLKYWSGIGV
jgi:hypothetical protein